MKIFNPSQVKEAALASSLCALIDQIIFPGVTILAGSSKAGKTILATQMAYSVAKGDSFLESFKTSKSGVLYLAFEENNTCISDRWKAMGLENDNLNNFEFGLDFPSMTQRGLDYLANHLQANPQIKLVIIDVWAVFAGGHATTYNKTYEAIAKIKEVADFFEVSFLILTHTTKSSAVKNWQHAVIGSVGMTSAADSILLLDRAPETNRAILKITGRSGTPEDLSLMLQHKPLRWIELQIPPLSEQQSSILEFLAEAKAPCRVKSIYGDLMLSKQSAGNMLKKLMNTGLVQRLAIGTYTITETGYEVVTEISKASTK